MRPSGGPTRAGPTAWRRSVVAVAVVAAAVIALTTTEVDRAGQDRQSMAGPQSAAGPIDLGREAFSWPSSIWGQVITGAPVGGDSAREVADLVHGVTAEGGTAAFNVWQYNTSLVTVAAAQPRLRVTYTNCQHKTSMPAGLYGTGGQFVDVPIPTWAIPTAGSDSELSVWSPSADQLWEFWKIHRTGNTWSACWGGRIDHMSHSQGMFPLPFGATATGIANIGGSVTIAEARALRIDHALALQIPDPAPWHDLSWPALRSDGRPSSTGVTAEGTRFRLDPSVNVDALPLSPLGKAVARAAQRYGFIVTDTAGTVAMLAQSGAVAAGATGTDPWGAILGATKSYQVLRGFPWSQVQALPAGWGRPAAGSTTLPNLGSAAGGRAITAGGGATAGRG